MRLPSAELTTSRMHRLVLLSMLVLAAPAMGQSSLHSTNVSDETEAAHTRAMELAHRESLTLNAPGDIVQRIAEHFLGAPYVAGMLDRSNVETLVVDLTGFDCVLYVEAVLALARTIEEASIEAFSREVGSLRYRDGQLSDYCSRLHYFSDWLYDNDRRGSVEVITDRLPHARSFDRRIGFMTANRSAYRGLADGRQLACVAGMEREINLRSMSYVPQESIAAAYAHLLGGDIVAITSSIDGLDIAHTGFVYRFDDGRTGFIHASTTGEVRLEPDLASYVQRNRRQTGIMVARPLATD